MLSVAVTDTSVLVEWWHSAVARYLLLRIVCQRVIQRHNEGAQHSTAHEILALITGLCAACCMCVGCCELDAMAENWLEGMPLHLRMPVGISERVSV